ncbi:magnesium transporter CorA family protein [Cryobacterium sp. TMT2-42-4]|uniref:magnesium transporter CorA family protein n=1 Tax=Cryobacterium sp. TMT2-42-4 TaxID=1259255 RepID=UPI00106D4460|nr:magnesium transporter CorA family protein [Cryobacterium sp. TMT2-42-4]TFC35076.1 magnesium transporter [Cryobacterium sp. TMT2-42-4]
MPTPRTRCYRDGSLVDEDFPLSEVSEHLALSGAVVWVDLADPGEEDLAHLAGELGLHELAVEDALTLQQRPKLDRYPDHLFLSAYSAEFGVATAQVTTHEIAAFITDRALVTVHTGAFDLEAVVARWDSASDLARNGVAFLLHGLLDHLVDGYFDAVEALDDQIEELEDQLFLPGTKQEAVQRASFELRKSLLTLRRVILPMREVVNTLLRRDLHLLRDEMGPYFQDVYDHVLRVMEWTESLRDQATAILEANLAIQGNRLNVITKKVTGYAAIIAVPTAITGFYGQNVPYPGFAQPLGYYSSAALIVGLSTLLYVLFKRNDWI